MNLIHKKLQSLDYVSNCTAPEKPVPEQYGWREQQGFDDEPSGWMFEGGEEAYYEALKKWGYLQVKTHGQKITPNN